MSISSLDNRRTPERRTPLQGGAIVERLTPATLTYTGNASLTAAQLAKKFLPIDTQETTTLTLPTASEIAAANPGVNVGDVLAFEIINFGDSVLTIAVGTGITSKVITTKSAVLTIAAYASKQFRLVMTAKANPSDPSTSNTFDLYGFGSIGSAVA